MKVSKITLPIFLFGLIIFLLTSCAGITPVTPTPSPGTTDEDNTVINGTIKMPFTCCILKSEKQNTKNNSTKTESWAVIPGAVVELKSTENCKTLLDTTISDKSGNYTFKDVKPGIYIITAYCPSDRKYLTKDVVEKPLGQAVDAGTPDCNSTSLALVIEYLKDCYGEDYSCFNKKSSVYNMVKTIAGAVNQLDIDAIENNSNYDELVTMVSDAIYSCCGVISPGTTPSADSGGSSGTPSSVTKTTINAAVIPGIKAPVTGEVPVTTIADIAVKSAVSGSSKSNTQYTGTVSWKPEHDKFQGNTVYTATITLTPNDGYTLSGVPSNFFKVEGADSISNPANSGVVTAIFPKTESEKYTVTFPGPDNGSLSAKVDDVAINSGDDIEKGKPVVFTADPDSGYQVKVWKLNNIEVGSTELTYTVSDLQEDITVSVEFELIPANTYEVTFSVKTGNGSIFATDDGTTIASGDAVEEGSKVVFTATPVQDWQIKDWYINGSSIGSTNETYTIDSLSSDINITVEFEEIPPATYEVTFKETNKLDGVSIQLYSDANRTQPLGGPGTTNQNGEAVRTLIDGNYWFTASFNGYEDFEDNFEVNEGDKTVEFEMVSTVQPTGLILWLDAEDYSSGTWPDKSGTGNTVSQNTSGNQPTLVTNGLNGNPVVRFDGTDDYLDLEWNLPDDSLSTDSITIFMVLKNNDMSGGSQTIMGRFNQAGHVSFRKSGTEDVVYAMAGVYENRVYHQDPNGVGDAGPYVLGFQYDHSVETHRAFVNGVQTDEKTNTAVDINWPATSIGKDNSASSTEWAGDIAEIRIYNYALDSTERAVVEAELQSKWLPLPDTHTVTFADPVNGTLTAEVDGSTINSGTEVEEGKDILFTVVPTGNFVVDKWTVNGSTVSDETSLTYNHEGLSEDIEVTVDLKEVPQADGLVLWLDANEYNSGSGTWPDKSGTGNTVSQNTSGNQPTLVTNGLNGNPVVRFDGSQYLNLDWNLPNSSLTTDAITIFLVLKNDDMNGGTQVVMGNYNSTDEVSISISSQNDSIVARITDYNTSCTFTDQPGPYVLTFDYDSATMRTFVDGLLTDNFSTNEDIDWESTAIGRDGAGTSRYWAGDIAEIRIYDSVLSDIERQGIEAELQSKWLTGSTQPSGDLILHLDANDYLNGNWPDQTIYNNEVIQTSDDYKPAYIIDGLNGNPVVRFDGNDDYLDLNWNLPDDSLSTDSITIFMVLKSNNMNDSQTVMGNYNEPGDICFHVSQNQNALTATVSSRDNRIDIGNSTEPYVATYKVTPTSHTAYVNGVQSTTGSLTESINWGTTTIGKNGGTLGANILDWFWSGDIAEIQIYDYALSNNERQAIESDLQSKWLTGGGTGPGPLFDAIVIYADPQNSTNHPATVAHVLTINPHTVLIPGDLVDIASSTTEWNTFNNLVDDYNLLYTTRGNHDGSTNWEGRYDNYYSEDINLGGYTVHLIVLDTNDTSSTYGGMVLTGDIGDTQKAWFEADLLANISADFTIVSFHHPVYSSGIHGDSSALQTKLVPLFEDYGVDMVFYGHDHTCEVNTFNDIHYVQTCGGSPRDGSNPNYCLLTVMGNELVGEIYDITGSQLGSSFSSETSGLLTGTIYQQVSLFTDGKNYIITAKDGADYYAVEFNPPAENNYFVLSESVEVIDGIDYGLDGTNIIVDPDDADLVWTATSTSDKYYLENTDYYLYGGNVNPQTGQSSGSGTIDFYNLESSRPCDIDGTNFYAYSSNSGEYYLTFDNITYEFGCSDAKAISQAAEVYIFEETDIE